MRLSDFFKKVLFTLKIQFRPEYYGFVQGHSYLTNYQINQIKNLTKEPNYELVKQFEKEFSSLIGNGKAISFAAGRMAFYSLMKLMKIGIGDEVILLGSTCSVMPNAVLRTGAEPIFADIDKNTFGSSAIEIEKKITSNTKMIVAQHSFGIPCNISEIVDLGRRKNIFVLEDCAITFDSTCNGIKVGNFGDAAIFSFDHSKPINTLVGGMFYTINSDLYDEMKTYTKNINSLTLKHQERLFKQLLWEKKYYSPLKYNRGILLNYFRTRLFPKKNGYIFFEADYSNKSSNEKKSYPYPAKLPSFLAQLGLFELEKWKGEKKLRIELLEKYKQLSKELNLVKYLPNSYYDKRLEIVPLRFVFAYPESKNIKRKLSKYLDISWFWFQEPVITCKNPIELKYEYGSCNTAEILGKDIINVPCVIPYIYQNKLLNIFQSCFK